ncbi:MAG: hypothetical protein ACRDNW_04630 [Trebonia sp.]
MDSERLAVSPVPTGDPRVDAVIRGLASLAVTDLAGQPAVLEEIHERLREILGELGDPGGPRQAGPGRPGEQGELSGAVAPGPLPRDPGGARRP